MIRRILVPLDISSFSESATARACEIAKAHMPATVSGMAVVDTPNIVIENAPIHAILIPRAEERTTQMTQEASLQLKSTLDRFRSTCTAQGVPHEEFFLKGMPSARVLEASFYHDLTVIGLRTFFHFETHSDPDGQSLKDILAKAPSPVLAVPGPAHAKPFETVLIAFDGSHNAIRALREFTMFAIPYHFEIRILTSGSDHEQAKHHADHAQIYLASHGITNVKTEITQEKIIPKVERDYLSWADLIVAGVHSRHHLGELLIGSFTKFLIDRSQTTLFLSQ